MTIIVVSTNETDDDHGDEEKNNEFTTVGSVREDGEPKTASTKEIDHNQRNSTNGTSRLLFDDEAESDEERPRKPKLLFEDKHSKETSEES
jgi:hypothetical protein